MNAKLTRLESEYNEIRSYFDTSEKINIVETRGNPPERYTVEYNIKGLEVDASGQIRIKEVFQIEISLPIDYPRSPPRCKPLSSVFHPNFSPSSICIGDFWAASETLCDLIVRIGMMIAYQSFNIQSPLNGEAAKWADENRDKLPIDKFEMFQENAGAQISAKEATVVSKPPSPSCENCGAVSELSNCMGRHYVCDDCTIASCSVCRGNICVLCDDHHICHKCNTGIEEIKLEYNKIKSTSFLDAGIYLKEVIDNGKEHTKIVDLLDEFNKELTYVEGIERDVNILFNERKYILSNQKIYELPNSYKSDAINEIKLFLDDRVDKINQLSQDGERLRSTDIKKALDVYLEIKDLTCDFYNIKETINEISKEIDLKEELLLKAEYCIEERDCFAANDILGQLTKNYTNSKIDELARYTTDRMAKAKDVFAKGEKEKDLIVLKRLYGEVKAIANDYPYIDVLIKKNTVFLKSLESNYQTISKLIEDKKIAKANVVIKNIQKTYHDEDIIAKFIMCCEVHELSIKKRNRLIANSLIGVLSCFMVLMGLFALKNYSLASYRKANDYFVNGVNLIEQNNFKKARIELRLARKFLWRAYLSKIKEASLLSEKINSQLNSEKYLRGINGNIMHNGSYVPISKYEEILKLESLITTGDGMRRDSFFLGALNEYSNAIKLCNKLLPAYCTNETLKKTTDKINETKILQIEGLIEKADNYFERKQWEESKVSYKECLAYYNLSGLNNSSFLNHINDRYRKSNINIEIAQKNKEKEKRSAERETLKRKLVEMVREAERNYSQSKWTNAKLLYGYCKEFYEKNSINDEKLLGAISSRIYMSNVNTVIANGDYSYENNKHLDALNYYTNALSLLKNNNINDKQLVNALNKKTSEATYSLANNNYIATVNKYNYLVSINRYDDALESLESSQVFFENINKPEDKSINEIQVKLKKLASEHQDRVLIPILTGYLEDRIESLLSSAHGVSAGFSTTQINLHSKNNMEYVFKISGSMFFINSNQRERITYGLKCSYHVASKTWSFSDRSHYKINM
jgi:ubiquitin-protein ligase